MRMCMICAKSKVPEDYVACTAIVCAECMLDYRPKRLQKKAPRYSYKNPNRDYYSLQRFLRVWAHRLEV